jgi:hypothetical protein
MSPPGHRRQESNLLGSHDNFDRSIAVRDASPFSRLQKPKNLSRTLTNLTFGIKSVKGINASSESV